MTDEILAEPYGRIYCVTNSVNGKRYVGQTIRSLRDRWLRHVADSKHASVPLGRAICKHGPDAFVIEQIATAVDQRALNAAEADWIVALGTTVPDGYNLRDGGGQFGRPHPTTLDTISDRLRSAWADVAKREAWEFGLRQRWQDEEFRKRMTARLGAPELRAKIAAALRTPESRAKLSAVMSTPEQLVRQAEQSRRQWQRDGYRDEMRATLKAAQNRPDVRAKRDATNSDPAVFERRSEAAKRKWGDADQRSKLMAKRDTPEFREYLSSSRKAQWADPAFREMMMVKFAAPESRARRSAALKGRPVSAETRAKQSAAAIKRNAERKRG